MNAKCRWNAWGPSIVRLLLPTLVGLSLLILLIRPMEAQTTPDAANRSGSGSGQVVRVYFSDSAELDAILAATGGALDVWSVAHGGDDGSHLVAMVDAEQASALRQAGFRMVRDTQRTAEVENTRARIRRATAAAPQDKGVPGYPCYRTVEETHADMAQLAAEHPLLASWIDAGDSWDRVTPGGPTGYDLPVLVVSNKASTAPKYRFFLMGAIHAREMTTAETAARFAEELIHGYGVDPDVTWLLDYAEIHIMPVANPDGRKWAEEGYYWRKNTNNTDGCVTLITGEPKFPDYGVDLNRNSSFKWNECEGVNCSSGNACSLTYRGSAPASEPETRAVQAYMTSIFADQRGPLDGDAASSTASGLFITLHSYSELVLFPWGWSAAPTGNDTALETLGRKFGYFTGYQVCQAGEPGCIYPTDGATDDWAYGELGIASYTFELGTSFFQSCDYFETTILPAVMPALRYAAKAGRRPYQTPAGPEVRALRVNASRVAPGEPISVTAIADDARYASNGWGDEPTQAIMAARYTVDAPAWISGTEAFTLTVADGAWDAVTETVASTIDTTGWAAGRHTVFVEAQDAAGNWGVPSAVFVDVAAPHEVRLSAIELLGQGYAGELVPHTLTLTNTGLLSDAFDLHARSEWPLALPDRIGPLAPGAAASIPITVSIPSTAAIDMTETALISVTGSVTNTVLATLRVTTRVDARDTYLPWIARE